MTWYPECPKCHELCGLLARRCSACGYPLYEGRDGDDEQDSTVLPVLRQGDLTDRTSMWSPRPPTGDRRGDAARSGMGSGDDA